MSRDVKYSINFPVTAMLHACHAFAHFLVEVGQQTARHGAVTKITELNIMAQKVKMGQN